MMRRKQTAMSQSVIKSTLLSVMVLAVTSACVITKDRTGTFLKLRALSLN